MKKFLSLVLLASMALSSGLQAGRGGAIAGGIIGGMALGSMIGAAAAENRYRDRPYYDRYGDEFFEEDGWDY